MELMASNFTFKNSILHINRMLDPPDRSVYPLSPQCYAEVNSTNDHGCRKHFIKGHTQSNTEHSSEHHCDFSALQKPETLNLSTALLLLMW